MLTKLFSRACKSLSLRTTKPDLIAPAPLDPLEPRLHLAAAPRITEMAADNRGLVTLTLDQPLNPATVTGKSALIYVTSKGKDRSAKAAVAYNTTTKQISLSAPLAPNTPYKIYLNSRYIKGADGSKLDGEFVKAGKRTGNGVAGGDLLVQANAPALAKTWARFYTPLGNIDVKFFSQTPLTVQNFLSYMNATGSDSGYSYDNTFFHRSVSNFVIQGGGFRVVPPGDKFDTTNIQSITQRPAVPNEPPSEKGTPGNIRGTIAMAKLGENANSATNQWFFNFADNRAILDNQNGGFTVFGQIVNNAGLTVMDKIAALKAFNLADNSPFTETPLLNNGEPALARGSVQPKSDLVIIRRIATLMPITAVPKK